jgi:outer membrane protein, multidrug efflux system
VHWGLWRFGVLTTLGAALVWGAGPACAALPNWLKTRRPNGQQQALVQQVGTQSPQWQGAAPAGTLPATPVPLGLTLDNRVTITPADPAQALKQWWTVFGDETLNGLVAKALRDNPGLKANAQALAASREFQRQAKTLLLPTVSFNPAYLRQRFSGNNIFPFGGFVVGQYSLPVSFSYEFDYLLKSRDAYEVVKIEYEVLTLDREALTQLVAAQVVQAYVRYLGAGSQLSALHEEAALLDERTTLSGARQHSGLERPDQGSYADDVRVSDVGRLREVAQKQRQDYRLQLAALVGETPASFTTLAALDTPTTPASLSRLTLPEELPVGTPLGLLSLRPDLRAAELMIQDYELRTRIARKDLLPSITLNADFGFLSRSFSNLVDWQSRIWSYGGALSQTLFDAGKKLSILREQKLRTREQLSRYQEAVLNAYSEVERSLSVAYREAREHQLLSAQWQTLDTQAALTRARFDGGLVDRRPVLDQTYQALVTRRQWITLHERQFLNVATVYQALGSRLTP